MLIGAGYVKPLYLQPMYQKRIAFGSNGYPFNLTERTYEKGLCPITELMHEKKLITHELMRPPANKSDLDDVVEAFLKVADNLKELEENSIKESSINTFELDEYFQVKKH